MESPVASIRYAPTVQSSPVFTVAAVLTLALGIGGTTAIFTLMNAVMLQSLPVVDPSRLYRIGDGNDCCVEGGPQDRWGMFSFPLYERLEAATPEFDEVTAFQAGGWRLASGVKASRWRRDRCAPSSSPATTSTLGVNAFGGRVLTPEDDRAPAPPVAVLSHQVWQGVYGGDPAPVGGSTFVVQGIRSRSSGLRRRVFRRDVARRSARDVDSAAAGAAHHRRELPAAPVGVGVAAGHRPLPAGRLDRGHRAAPDRIAASVDATRVGLSVQLDAGHHSRCFPSRSSTWSQPAPASA